MCIITLFQCFQRRAFFLRVFEWIRLICMMTLAPHPKECFQICAFFPGSLSGSAGYDYCCISSSKISRAGPHRTILRALVEMLFIKTLTKSPLP